MNAVGMSRQSSLLHNTATELTPLYPSETAQLKVQKKGLGKLGRDLLPRGCRADDDRGWGEGVDNLLEGQKKPLIQITVAVCHKVVDIPVEFKEDEWKSKNQENIIERWVGTKRKKSY